MPLLAAPKRGTPMIFWLMRLWALKKLWNFFRGSATNRQQAAQRR
jgi:hypothetical protein